jgi:diketogulonate reductase-like aldo/keto reductase
LTLIDTAEAYGGGLAEEMIGRVITGQRDHVCIVSKVVPSHADPARIRRACKGSLGRLGTDHLDLYLLHWRDGIRDLSPVVSTFEELKAAGRIRRWGVSNFRVGDMEDLLRVPAGDRCAINQSRVQPRQSADRTRSSALVSAAQTADHGLFGPAWR